MTSSWCCFTWTHLVTLNFKCLQPPMHSTTLGLCPPHTKCSCPQSQHIFRNIKSVMFHHVLTCFCCQVTIATICTIFGFKTNVLLYILVVPDIENRKIPLVGWSCNLLTTPLCHVSHSAGLTCLSVYLANWLVLTLFGISPSCRQPYRLKVWTVVEFPWKGS